MTVTDLRDHPRGASPALPSVSIVVCTYTDVRWPLLSKAVATIREQETGPIQLVVVVDHNPKLLARLREAVADAVVVPNVQGRGLAGGRNTALMHASGDVVVFLDDDACPEPGWLHRLLEAYRNPRVVGAGGSVEPAWANRPPRWLPPEFFWVIGCSWTGLPDQVAPVRNPIGASMSFRRSAFAIAGTFTDGIGRDATNGMGCEETEFAIRLHQTLPDAVVLYVPNARVRHHVDESRASWRYFLRRCVAEGRSKALVASYVGTADALASERHYTRQVLPAGIARGVVEAWRGDVGGALRSGVIVIGLVVTVYGYATGELRLRWRRLRRRRP